MPGINQLPTGAEGAAAFSLTYSAVSWICSGLFILAARVYREGFSYISILAYFTLFSTTASIIQQCHDAMWYTDVMINQFEHKKLHHNNPDNAIANGSIGLDLVLYYLQYYSYNVEAMLVMFWTGELAQTVYGLSAKRALRPLLHRINTVGKWIAVLFPMVTILLLRVPAVQEHFVVFILIADLPLMISLAIGSSTVVAILARYVKSRRSLTDWKPEHSTGNTSESGATMQNTTQSSQGKTPTRQSGLYDRWLMVRFTCAFVVLAAFEATNTLFQVQSVLNNRKDAASLAPDLSAERAKTTFFLFVPGNTQGIFVFLVFGTTAGCRKAMYDIFVPQRCRGSGGRGCIPWRSRDTRPAPDGTRTDPESSLLYDRSEDTRSYTTLSRRSKLAKSPDLMKPLPAMTSPRHNKSYGIEYDNPSPEPSLDWHSRGDRDRRVESGQGGIPLHHMRSLDSVKEEYYQPQAEQSDDSGTILPIMREQDCEVPRGSVRWPLQGERAMRKPSIANDYGYHGK